MPLIDALNEYEVVVENGPLGTRLQYDYGFELGPNLTTFDLIKQESGRKALEEIYRGDIEVAQHYGMPIIVNAATFRASKNHLLTRGFAGFENVKRINMDCINFVKKIREDYAETGSPIFVAAPIGAMYDAYSADPKPDVESAKIYHQEQVSIF